MKRTVKIVSVEATRSFTNKQGEEIRYTPVVVSWQEGVTNSDAVQEYSLVMEVRGELDQQKLSAYVGTGYTLDVNFYFDVRATKENHKFNKVTGYLPKEMYVVS